MSADIRALVGLVVAVLSISGGISAFISANDSDKYSTEIALGGVIAVIFGVFTIAAIGS